MTLKTIDFFAGGGGLSLGFQQAGFNVVCAVENWQPALDVYRANFPGHEAVSLDLSNEYETLQLLDSYRPDLIIGGPPCQDFSSAGKRDEGGGRASLTINYANVISQYRPSFFLMENVARAATSNAFKAALDIFKRAGYGLTIQLLNAAHCGAPQSRKRLIVLGQLNGKDGFLDHALTSGLSDQPMTLRQYFRNKLPFEHYYRHPRSYARRAVFSIDEPSPTIRGVNRPIPKGYPGHAGDPVPVGEGIRSLTTQERALIQTFPAKFKLPGSKSDVEQVIGNAVPVKLAEYVAKALAHYLTQCEDAQTLPMNGQLFEPRRVLRAA
ncbi:MAG: DNA (cytosine-5-)-methyltransferase [Burkholderiales bacterium PBB3]|nr:MAG: DNA (cytosine-5-)-methyltransferase [Burkholderiales bacterium PBB3]